MIKNQWIIEFVYSTVNSSFKVNAYLHLNYELYI